MYRTKAGISWMDKIARRASTFWQRLSLLGVVVGFVAMVGMSAFLIKITIDLFTKPTAAPGLALVLPVKLKGVFFVPLFYWIISIFVVATLHEFAHGVAARSYKLPVKHSGLAVLCLLLPLIPAAFVEPDEKALANASARAKLSVFAAGAFANILFALLLVFALGIPLPLLGKVVKTTAVVDIEHEIAKWSALDGIRVAEIVEGSPAALAGLKKGEIVKEIDGITISNLEALRAFEGLKPGKSVFLKTENKSYKLVAATHPDEKQKTADKGYLGISFEPVTKKPKQNAEVMLSLLALVVWVVQFNLGIGLANLLPIGPLDGGRMAQFGIERIFKKKGRLMWRWLSLFFGILALINIFAGFVK
ncbi:MAG: site-2 protease family protein [Candidatus Woesearchaeota archaeon]